jgi:hypothetical protein
VVDGFVVVKPIGLYLGIGVHVCTGAGGGGVHVDGTKILDIESALKAH